MRYSVCGTNIILKLFGKILITIQQRLIFWRFIFKLKDLQAVWHFNMSNCCYIVHTFLFTYLSTVCIYGYKWKHCLLVLWDLLNICPLGLMFISFLCCAMWTFLVCVCTCLCVSIFWLRACLPREKMRRCLLAEWFPLVSMFSVFSLLASILTISCREKQEATRDFLTSWPSDMIGSVLLPSQTKGFWKHRVCSWLGLHVAMDGGKEEGGDAEGENRERENGGDRERERSEEKQSCHAQHLFIQTVHLLCGLSLAGIQLTHTDTLSHALHPHFPKDQAAKGLLSDIPIFFLVIQVPMMGVSWVLIFLSSCLPNRQLITQYTQLSAQQGYKSHFQLLFCKGMSMHVPVFALYFLHVCWNFILQY